MRDLSRKQKTAIRVKGESGKPTTNCAIYGYKKMPGDKYSWYIDEEAAAVVRRIFRLTIEGNGPYDIARILYDDKVETLRSTPQSRGVAFGKAKRNFPTLITGVVISLVRFSQARIYGAYGQLPFSQAVLQGQKSGYESAGGLADFENTHEAIVDKEMWELAQKLRERHHDGTIHLAKPIR